MSPDMEKQFLKAYEAYADAIFRHCYFRVRNDRERARDLTQETFRRTWEYLAEGKEVENIRALLYRIAINLIIDQSRKQQEGSLETLVDGGFQPEDDGRDPTDVVDGALLREHLDRLEEDYREVLIMRYVDDLPVKEIATLLNERPNAIAVRIHRGIKKLREVTEGKL